MALRTATLILLLLWGGAMASLAGENPQTVRTLAGAAPADALLFAGFVPRAEEPDLAAWTKSLEPETLQQVEEWLGTRLADVFTWARPTGFAVLVPGAEPGAPEWALALALRDEAAARKAAERFAEGERGPALALAGGYLLAGSPAGVAHTAACIRSGTGGLARSPLFLEALERVPVERGVLLFSPARQALSGVGGTGPAGREALEAARSFDFVIMGEVNRGGRWLSESYLKLDSRASSPLAWTLLIPAQPSRDPAAWFPADVAAYGSVSFDTWYRPAMALLRWTGVGLHVPGVQALADALGGRLAFAADLVSLDRDGLPSLLFAAGVRDAAGVRNAASVLERHFAEERTRGAYSECQSNLKVVGTALEMFSTDFEGRFPKELGALVPDYLQSIPTCPAAGADTYSASYRAGDNSFAFQCQGRNHANVGVGPDLPRYDSTVGLTAPEPGPASTALARTTRTLEGAAVHGYAEFPLSWTIQGQGSDQVLLVGFGPGAEGLLTRSLRSRRGGDSVAAHRLYREMVEDAEGTVVATGFLRGRAILDAMLTIAAVVPDEAREVLAGVQAKDAAGYLAMEERGLRSVSSAPLSETLVPSLATLLPAFLEARAQGQLTACKSNLRNVGTALEMYSTDHSGRYPVPLSALTPNYLKTIPTCPSAGRDTYSAGYLSETSPDSYTLSCRGANHTAVGVPEDYPQYNWLQGLVEQP